MLMLLSYSKSLTSSQIRLREGGRRLLPGGGCDVGRGGMGLSSLGIFDPSCSVN